MVTLSTDMAGVVETRSSLTQDPPTARRTLVRLIRVWLIALMVFGYGPAFTYGLFTWLLNEDQWGWTYLMYFTLVPLIGGIGVLALPLWWHRPIHRALEAAVRGADPDPRRCAQIHRYTLRMPWRVAVSAFVSAAVGYSVGGIVILRASHPPVIELVKMLPAIPLVGSMMGAFCYFGTARALHPVLVWCSRFLDQVLPVRTVPMAAKFLTTTCVLATAMLCMLLPAAYTLGQVVNERHLKDLSLSRLRVAAQRMIPFERAEDRLRVLQTATLGPRGYVFAVESDGRIASPHPNGYTQLAQEGFRRIPEDVAAATEGVWVDRVGQHRVIARVTLAEPPWTLYAVSLPDDFGTPMRHFLLWSLLVLLEVLVVVAMFGHYYTRGITTPLDELTQAAREVAQRGELTRRVPVTTNDELSTLARSFNEMVSELQATQGKVDAYTRRLETGASELAAVNQEMEDLLHVVSHDLRAPLINIQGFSKRLEPLVQATSSTVDRMARQPDADLARQEAERWRREVEPQFTESLRYIGKGVEKMDALLASLLAISRVGRKADPLQPNDLNGILEDVLATFRHQLEERAIQVLRHPLPADVLCRRNEINQVFSNLLSNAINYMGASGQRFIEIGGSDGEEQVECYMRDTGVGIEPEDQPRIFQMFTRLQAVDAPGEGVGLAYVKKILRSHGGTIRVESARGQGSTFTVTLPKVQRAAAQRETT